MRLAVPAAMLALLLGCGGEAETVQPGTRDCGRYESRNTPVTPAQREANRCLLDALSSGQPARLVATRATVEGDPIVTTFEVHARDHVELRVDDTQDRFGDGSAETLACTGLREAGGFLEGTGCDPRE